MTHKEIRRANDMLLDSPPSMRQETAQLVVVTIDANLIDIADDTRNVEQQFQEELTARGIASNDGKPLKPHRRIDELSNARLYLAAGVLALCAELGISAWMFRNRGMSPWVGVIFAFVITLMLERAVHFVVMGVDGVGRPVRVLRMLKTLVFYPALICFLAAVVTIFAARAIEGSLAASETVIILISSSLLAFTLGLVFLAATFMNLAFIHRWSARLSEPHKALVKEDRATRAFRNELRGRYLHIYDETRASSSRTMVTIAPVPDVERAPQRGAPVVAALLIAGLANACGSISGTANATAAEYTEVGSGGLPQGACHVVVDISGSLSKLESAWAHVRAQLPQLVVHRNCGQLTVTTFSTDGWEWASLVDVQIPAKKISKERAVPAELRGTTFEIEIARDEARKAMVADGLRLRQVTQTLTVLDRVDHALKQARGTRSSDPVGVLKRIVATHSVHPQTYVVLTDMADSHFKSTLPPIAAPAAHVRVVVLLHPERVGGESGHEIGPVGAEQFERRLSMLRQATPWVLALPSFSQDLWSALEPRLATES
jgi:hypothetical protein